MSIKSGRYGKVSYDPLGGTAFAEILSINSWKGSFKTDYEDVSCYADVNKVYVPGLMDINGTFAGFWNSAETTLFKAAFATTPGTLQLMPNRNEPTFAWTGPAYMSADIDCSMAAPKVTGTFNASGPWTVPGQVTATGAGPGTGNGSFTPAGATPPANFAALSTVTANPATNWTAGQFILLADGSRAHWNGTIWVVGAHP